MIAFCCVCHPCVCSASSSEARSSTTLRYFRGRRQRATPRSEEDRCAPAAHRASDVVLLEGAGIGE
eukprot:4635205-Pleurochrysis_carterae.AAC.1